MNLLNLLILFFLLAGYMEIVVTVVNRSHSLRILGTSLRHFRHLHDGLVLVVPPLVVWCVGIHGPRLLLDGSWSELSAGWVVYFGLCTLGLAGLVFSSIRWHLQRAPQVQLSNDSHTVDVAEQLGYRPVGEGPFQFLTSVPGNEIFRIEVSEKEFRLPRLPAAWDGLSILHLSDLHFIGTVDLPYYEQVTRLSQEMRPDLIVFTGDLLDDMRFLDWLPTTLGQLTAPLGCYFILGNHDWYLQPDEIRRRLIDLGWQDVAGRTVALDHWDDTLVIGGTEEPWMGAHPDFTGAEPDAFRLLLSHSPDHLRRAKNQHVDLMLSGHNHGGQVVLPIIGPVYSPSVTGVKYAGGAFWEEPTLMCVSRGLAGRHALRLNCPPELTKLVLRAVPLDSASPAAAADTVVTLR